MRKIISRNPYTGEIFKEFDFITNEDLKAKIKKAEQGFKINRQRTIKERVAITENLCKII